MTPFVDTNVLVRHLTDDPPEMAGPATAFLRRGIPIHLADLIVAETVHVLDSVYLVPRPDIAALVRSIVADPMVVVADVAVLLRTLEIYEAHRLAFADAYLVAGAEAAGGSVVSFDRAIARVPGVRRIEP